MPRLSGILDEPIAGSWAMLLTLLSPACMYGMSLQKQHRSAIDNRLIQDLSGTIDGIYR
jgi:hypothetical protein